MSHLRRLSEDDGPEILAFELTNRTYFAASISDRGDEFFEDFDSGFEELLSVQNTGRDAYYVLVDEDDSILGRFNLLGIEGDAAELGYRVAQEVAGRGKATEATKELCRLAAAEFGLRRIRARTTLDNVASQKVLAKSGFLPIGTTEIHGQPATLYERELAEDGS